jgi:hypothetical protein
LKEESFKAEMFESLRRSQWLRKDKLEFLAMLKNEWRASLWTHTNPIKSRWRGLSAVGLYRNSEPNLVKRINCRRVQLEERLAPSANHVAFRSIVFSTSPRCTHRGSKISSRFEQTSAGPICTDKIRIAKLAYGGRTLGLTAGPQVAA